MVEKSCAYCGKTFYATRRDAKYCSKACKQIAYRGKKGGKDLKALAGTAKVEAPVPANPEKAALAAVMGVKSAIRMLDVASLAAKGESRTRYALLAQGLSDALRSVGL